MPEKILDKPAPTTAPPKSLKDILTPEQIKNIIDGQMIWTVDEEPKNE